MGCLSIAVGCSDPPAPQAPTDEGPAPTVVIAAPPASAENVVNVPPPVLAPLPVGARPCDAAAERRKAAEQALAAGRAYRALRGIAKADKECLNTAQSSWKTRLVALGQLGRDDAARALAREVLAATSPDPASAAEARAVLAKAAPATPAAPPAAQALVTSALAAHKSGAVDARAQLDRALSRLEQEVSAAPTAHFDVGQREALAISHDGAAAVISQGHTAIVIDTKDLSPRRFFDHAGRVVGAAVSPDGKQVATVEQGGEATLWSMATGKVVRRFSWAKEPASRVMFSTDGKRLVTAGGDPFDAVVRVWNAETGDSVERLSVKGSFEATAIAMSRDGKLLCVGTKLGTVELWRLGPPTLVATLAKPESFLESTRSIDFSPKGDRVAVVNGSGGIGVWETAQGKPKLEIDANRANGESIVFSADGSRLIGGGRSGFEGSIREWDAASGAELQNRPVGLEVELFSRDGKVGIGAGREGMGVLDVAARTVVSVATKSERFRSILFGPPRTLAFTVESEKVIRVVTPRGARQLQLGERPGAVALSIDGATLANADYRTVTAWDVATGSAQPPYPALTESVDGISFGPQGPELRTITRRSGALVVATASPGGAWKEVYREERGAARDVAMSTYGRFGLFLEEKRALLLDLSKGRATSLDDDPTERIDELEISPDGSAAFVVRDEKVTRFDTATKKATHAPAPIGCHPRDLAASFDGSRLVASCSGESVVLSFEPGQKAPIVTRPDLGQVAYEVLAIAPHGDLVATGHDEGGVRLWTHAGELRGELFPLSNVDATLLRSGDGRVLVLGRDASKVDSRLSCRVGSVGVPFVVCADALTDDDLLEEVLAPAP